MTLRWWSLILPMLLVAGPTSPFPPVRAQSGTAVGPLTLEQAADMALRDNPAMAAVESGRMVAAAQLSEARAGRFPLLQFTETYTNSNNPVFVFGSLLEQARFGPGSFAFDSLNSPGSVSNFRSALNLRIPVFNRFQVESRVSQAEIGRDAAAERDDLTRQQLRLAVIQSYFGAHVAEARRRVADEAVTLTEAEVKRIRDLYEQGTVVASDLLAMQVQLADFRQQQIQSAGEVLTAYAVLNTVLGQPLTARPSLAAELVDRDFVLPAQEALLEQALAARPDYRQTVLEGESHKQEIRRARGQYLPDFNVFASFGQSSRNLADGSSDFAVGANLTFNIVDLGRGARVEGAVAAQRAAEAQVRRKADEIRLEVVRAYQDYLAARERVRVASGAVEQAGEAARIAQDRHQVGLTTVTEVLRAQTALVRTRTNLLGARYDYYVGYAETLAATGQLKDVDVFTK